MSENLMEGLLNEIERVSGMISEYQMPYLKGAGAFAAALMKIDIDKAKKAISNDDVVSMIGSYKKLKEWEQ
jgi:hypothetical protein